jgi:NADPH:quinone reductase-like Zn-dependent oxidoreductase
MKVLPNFIAGRPHVVEHDFAGVIVDSNRTHFENGEQVFGWVPLGDFLTSYTMITVVLTDVIQGITRKTGQGALAQYVRVTADHIIRRPSNISPIQAAGITLAGLTAYQALNDIAKVETGQTIFISGGSTAVGAFAIQIAKSFGAKVIATASARNEEFVRKLGADEFMDYTKTDVPKILAERAPSPKFNVIFDAVGSVDSRLYSMSEAYLAPNGIFVTTGPLPQTSSASEFWKLFKTFGAVITPRWLGGTKRVWKYVAMPHVPFLRSFMRTGYFQYQTNQTISVRFKN